MVKSDRAWVKGPTDVPLLQVTIAERLYTISREFPDATAIKTPTCLLSYRELDRRSEALAIRLADLGIGTGDRVAISLGNNAQYAVICYACFKIGVVVVPLNPAYMAAQVISALNHISASCFVVSTEVALPYKPRRSTSSLLDEVLGDSDGPSSFSSNIKSLQQVLLVDNSTGRINLFDFRFTALYDALIATTSGELFTPRKGLTEADLATIQFTSGTTSSPKAACLSHHNVLNNAILVGRGMQITERDVICCPPPLYHCFGLVLGLLTAMNYGACLVLPSEAFDADAIRKSIIEDRPTALYGVPTMFIAELELFSKTNFQSQDLLHLRTGVIGGSPIPPSLRHTLHEKLNLTDLASCYGLTESSPIVCMTVPSDSEGHKLSTVGRVLPHTSIRIVARDDPAHVLAYGEKGELCISGYGVMQRYWEDPSRTSDALFIEEDDLKQQIWLKSGDEAIINEDGFISITGRIKDIIIRGGENIYPPEIENAILQCPGVGNVSVIGISDDRYGEVIGAFIVVKNGWVTDATEGWEAKVKGDREVQWPRLTAEAIKTWVQDRLSKMLVPKHVFWIDSMPLTASGKIEKYKLKELGMHLVASGRKL
ncbi:amp-binding enzyme [Phlyctema vagabunda]|uniref:Amp-binding enzyme n=1 Tax=Phlyctema vagabunda TaxID=108571 RepID=A0ABR4PEG3_9HELO